MNIFKITIIINLLIFLSPAGAVGPGTGDIATPPVRLSVCLSVTFSFHTVTQKRMQVRAPSDGGVLYSF